MGLNTRHSTQHYTTQLAMRIQRHLNAPLHHAMSLSSETNHCVQMPTTKKTHANSPFYLVCYLVVFLLVLGADFPLVTLRAGAFLGLGAAGMPTARVFVSPGDRYCTKVRCVCGGVRLAARLHSGTVVKPLSPLLRCAASAPLMSVWRGATGRLGPGRASEGGGPHTKPPTPLPRGLSGINAMHMHFEYFFDFFHLYSTGTGSLLIAIGRITHRRRIG